jgi:single-strand DNA-binding protein
MLCKNRITLIGFLCQDAESRATPNGNGYTRFSLATSVSWKENGSTNTRRPPNGIASSAGTSWRNGQVAYAKGAHVKEGELRYREYTPAEPDRIRVRRFMRIRFWR